MPDEVGDGGAVIVDDVGGFERGGIDDVDGLSDGGGDERAIGVPRATLGPAARELEFAGVSSGDVVEAEDAVLAESGYG